MKLGALYVRYLALSSAGSAANGRRGDRRKVKRAPEDVARVKVIDKLLISPTPDQPRIAELLILRFVAVRFLRLAVPALAGSVFAIRRSQARQGTVWIDVGTRHVNGTDGRHRRNV